MLMATTIRLIGKQILSADTASVTFSDIPGGMTDLLLVCSARTARATNNDILKLEFNGSTTSYSVRWLEGGGTLASSDNLTEFFGAIATAANATASTFGNSECYIPNYAGSTNKSASMTGVSENNSSASGAVSTTAAASLWSNTAAITSIKVVSRVASDLKSGSSFFLFGITKS